MKYKARIFYNVVEEIVLDADSYADAKEKAYLLGGTGKTITDEIDFTEIDEITEEVV